MRIIKIIKIIKIRYVICISLVFDLTKFLFCNGFIWNLQNKLNIFMNNNMSPRRESKAQPSDLRWDAPLRKNNIH